MAFRPICIEARAQQKRRIDSSESKIVFKGRESKTIVKRNVLVIGEDCSLSAAVFRTKNKEIKQTWWEIGRNKRISSKEKEKKENRDAENRFLNVLPIDWSNARPNNNFKKDALV